MEPGTESTDELQDSGLRDSRLLAQLLPVGIVMLDEAQRCCFASRGACELLGAADEAALREDWHSIGAQFDLDDLSRSPLDGPPLQRRIDLRTASGTRLLRFEVHAVPGDRLQHVMLLCARDHLGHADRTLLLASEALANRHVLTGLVHEAKGPLNNFGLTLALFTSAMERADSTPLSEATLARWQRYLGVLRTEAARLSGCLNDIHALTQSGDAIRERIDVGAALREAMRVMRHDATMREVTVQLELPAAPASIVGDPHAVRLALLGFTTCMLDVTRPGGVLTWRIVPPGADPRLLLQVHATQAAFPPALVAKIFGISRIAESDHEAAVAGRLIVEAHGGEVTIDPEGDGRCGFSIRLDSARDDGYAEE